MVLDGYAFMVDVATKFFNSVRIEGWFHHPNDTLASVELIDDDQLAVVGEVGIAYPGVATLGPNKGFALQILRRTSTVNEQARLRFTTTSGWHGEVSVADLAHERTMHYPSLKLLKRFADSVEAIPRARFLDVGGRARSGNSHRELFHVKNYVVFDVLPGSNVDVVGDAHELSKYFPPEYFDAVLSVAVFEHLMMPWTVVTEINRVLKVGGLAMILTHQTLGLHDVPWDFWRYSDMAWDALFNARTGFEVLDRILDSEQFVIPMILRPGKHDLEKWFGYEGSSVLVRKVGPCSMSWPLRPADITTTTYPV